MGLEHLPHLYDDRELTYNQIEEILTKAAKGELKGTEKVDGLNLYLGYKDGQPKAARNNYDIKNGGLSAEELAQREFHDEHVGEVFALAFQSFANLVSKLDRKLLDIIFGPTGNIFLNTEILNNSTKRVINYGDDLILIHRSGHKKFNEETNEVESVREDTSKAISHIINKMNDIMNKEVEQTQFKVQQDPITQLPALEDQSVLADSLQRLKTAGFSGDMTIHQFLFNQIKRIVNEKLPSLNEKNTNDVVNKIIGVKGTPTITVLKKYVDENPNFTKELQDLVSSRKKLINDVMFPIEDAIHDFAVEILKKMNSSFVKNPEEEAQRIKQELENELKRLKNYDGPNKEQVIDNLKRHLLKIKHISNVTSPLEGFVFNFNNKNYKLTGNFAPVNQIMGLYNKTLNENKEKKIALFPGSFRPPHKGHLELIKQALPEYSKVIVLISKPEKHHRSDITQEQSKKIFDLYTKGMPVEVRTCSEASPYVEASKMIDNGLGNIVLTSNKEPTKFDKFNFPKRVISTISPVSSSEIRNILDSSKTREEKKKELLGYLPENNIDNVLNILLKGDKTIQLNEVFEIIEEVSIKQHKSFTNIELNDIFNILDEMATAGGGVSGVSSNLEGSPVSSFETRKRKKEKKTVSIQEILEMTNKFLKESNND